MAKKQELNPYAYGYARMPRIIRKGYKNLTNMQKLLYIYLRDLCGEDGTCYRSLRSLKDETGFSIGYLSAAIPVLHNEGLIHAEMRKNRSTHWEVWHISVVDIWEKNAQFLQKCSPDEHSDEQSVHQMNRSVHQMNSISESVQEVNESVHAMTLNKNNTNNQLTENNDREEGTFVTSANAEVDVPTFAFQIQDFPLHFYHDYCIHAQDRGINDGLVLIVRNLAEVPNDAECDICYKPIHGAHGYFEIGKVTDLQEWKKITDKHKAVHVDLEETQKMPAIPKVEVVDVVPVHSHPDSVGPDTDGLGATINAILPDTLAAAHTSGRAGDMRGGGDLAPERQVINGDTHPVPSELSSSTHSSGGDSAHARLDTSSRKKAKKVVQAKPTFTLTAQQTAFWDLWCNVWFNQDIKPVMSEAAYKHTCKLAPYITTDEQLNSLIDYTRKDLADAQGIKRKMVHLGNMVYCYAGWKQAQQKPAKTIMKSGIDEQYSIQAMLRRQEAM